MRPFGVLQGLIGSQVLFALQHPYFELLTIEKIRPPPVTNKFNALDRAFGAQAVPLEGPTLQRTFAEGNRFGARDRKRLLDIDRSLIADRDGVSRGLKRGGEIIFRHASNRSKESQQPSRYPQRGDGYSALIFLAPLKNFVQNKQAVFC